MPNYRKFTLSHDLFSGYTMAVDLDTVDSKEDIINHVCTAIQSLFVKNSLDILIKKLNESKLHIHDYEFGDILMSNPEKDFYICGHC